MLVEIAESQAEWEAQAYRKEMVDVLVELSLSRISLDPLLEAERHNVGRDMGTTNSSVRGAICCGGGLDMITNSIKSCLRSRDGNCSLDKLWS